MSDSWDFLAYSRGPSCIPGLSGSDVIHGSVGQGKLGHSLYEREPSDKKKLMDKKLHARVAFWLRPKAFSLKEIKMECKSQGLPVTGNKKVFALRLAFKGLPNDVESSLSDGYTITESSPNKRGGKRVRMGDTVAATTSGKSNNAKTRSVSGKDNDVSKKAAKKVKQTKKPALADKDDNVVVDTMCKKCGEGYVAECEGRNCNKRTLRCDCNDGEWKVGVSHCGECEQAYCHECRLRYGMGCTSCEMMAE